ncbi:hypothetical protein G7075_11790 [Phycicoccus sp. HDW14]|nr:hypothetical protein [Phycicoccus sp. HDW14]QIM21650.1 hypothetical protein G7075_11790 [Phycicoccus sp. HDW14]
MATQDGEDDGLGVVLGLAVVGVADEAVLDGAASGCRRSSRRGPRPALR